MFVLVLGYSKAGKSRYAEQLAARMAQGPLVYVATMIPVGEGEEGAATVRRHRAQREGLGFETVERPFDVGALALPQNATVLLEDVSNLLANNLFCEGRGGGAEESCRDVLALRDKAQHLLAVSFHGLVPGEEYDAPTNAYIRDLETLNERLARKADAVVMLEQGVARVVRGGLPRV